MFRKHGRVFSKKLRKFKNVWDGYPGQKNDVIHCTGLIGDEERPDDAVAYQEVLT